MSNMDTMYAAFSNLEHKDSTLERNFLPTGVYQAKVAKVEIVTSNNGTTTARLRFEAEVDGKKAVSFSNYGLGPVQENDKASGKSVWRPTATNYAIQADACPAIGMVKVSQEQFLATLEEQVGRLTKTAKYKGKEAAARRDAFAAIAQTQIIEQTKPLEALNGLLVMIAVTTSDRTNPMTGEVTPLTSAVIKALPTAASPTA
jgi:hypothetical protein